VIVHSAGGLQTISTAMPPLDTAPGGAQGSWIDRMSAATYAWIYRTQPNVRKVIDFIARNIAQVGLHAYRRISDLDRERLSGHDVLQWLDQPNGGTSRYRLFDALMKDIGIYFNAYWLKVRKPDGAIGLVRLPPEQMTVDGWLVPSGYVWTLPDGRRMPLPLDAVVYFGGYDPHNPLMGLSPLETLRQVLAEDAAQTAYRADYWRKGSRIDGVVTRPMGAPKWTPDQKQMFREQWQAKYVGGAVTTVVLDEGMDYKPNAFNARDSEFTATRKLTAEEVISAYHVPLPLVGILEHATFSNIKEQHKQLYQDCLGPWLQMIAEDLERQLLPEASDSEGVYLEFNIADKMKGSFEEQASSLYYMVGRPLMTANEGRARLNLPRMTDDPSADQIVLPLNQTTGGTAPVPPLPDQPDQADADALVLPAPVARPTFPAPVAARLAVLEALIDTVREVA
jgi:HK97 family phage portal protein